MSGIGHKAHYYLAGGRWQRIERVGTHVIWKMMPLGWHPGNPGRF
jgi:hypothetical protein